MREFMLRWETNMKSRYLSCDVLRNISYWLFFGKMLFWAGYETQCIWDNKKNLIILRYTDSNSQTKMSIFYPQGDLLYYNNPLTSMYENWKVLTNHFRCYTNCVMYAVLPIWPFHRLIFLFTSDLCYGV